MEKYYGYYRCRNCGVEFARCEINNFEEVFENMILLTNGENPTLPKLFAPHFCDKTNQDTLSLADFIGFKKVK